MENEDFSSLSKKKLKTLIQETQEVLDQLKGELKQRKLDKRHEEIDHMEEHFEDAAHNLSNLKNFIQKVFSEMRKDK
ncbi:MAG: hypothetical protein COB49_05085 [Alphaproteobacteria bacterium]|nr:MAG: hypothetical protein COB49_05085 [Alphaproteobacteria bacterium]